MNPVLKENKFSPAGSQVIVQDGECMTIRGSIFKTSFLLVLLLLAAAFSWKVTNTSINPSSPLIYMIGGIIGGFILAMIITFVPKTAPYLSPLYAIAEGFALGCISAVYNQSAIASAQANGTVADPNGISGLISRAILLTIITTFIILIVYRSGAIKIDGRFNRIMKVAIISVLVFYLIGIGVAFFGGRDGQLYNIFFGNSILAIVINLLIVCIAAFSLMQDFDLIVKGSQMGAPKYMEWYAAFGLMVTLIWLYLEILRLLSRIQSRN